MAFCPKCGTAVEGRFCAKCGASVDAGGAPAGPPMAPPPPMATSAAMQENVASALCYALGFITGILFLVLEPYNRNRNIKFHAWQSIFLSVAYIILNILVGMVFAATFYFGTFWFLWMAVRLAFFILWIYMMYSAYNNRRVKLPVIGDLAEKQA